MDYLIHLITSLGYLGYAIIFIIIFLESFPLTFFLPGDSLLFTTGFLASQGYFSPLTLFVVIFFAGTFGYIFSYVTGEKIRGFILRSNDKYWFKKKHIDYTDEFYHKYGAKTLILGRFVPIVRSFAPTLAGAVDMNFKEFMKYVFIGGILWTGGVICVGFYLGKAIPGAHLYLTPIIVAIVFVSLLPAIVEFVRSHRKRKAI